MTYQPDEQTKQDYIQNKLSPDAKSEFENWLFDNKDAQDELELDLILKSGVKQYYEEANEVNAKKVTWLPAFGMAAALVLMTWGLLVPHKDEVLESGLVAPQVSVLSQVRSAEQLTWKINGNQAQLIQIPVAYLSTDLYQIEIFSIQDDSAQILALKDLEPNLDMVSVIVSKGTLAVAEYRLDMTAQVSQEKESYKIQVL